MMIIQEFVFEIGNGMNEYECDLRNSWRCLSSSEKRVKKLGLNADSNPAICDVDPVVHHLGFGL